MKLFSITALAALLAFAAAGCSTVLPIVGSVATLGIDYNGKNCPSKTFTCSLDCVHGGVLEALDSMSMKVASDQKTKDGRKVEATANGEGVTVDLTRLSQTTTKLHVTASTHVILRDGATARELIAQVEEALVRRGALPAEGVASLQPTRPATASAS